jgi:hypothetical protein
VPQHMRIAEGFNISCAKTVITCRGALTTVASNGSQRTAAVDVAYHVGARRSKKSIVAMIPVVDRQHRSVDALIANVSNLSRMLVFQDQGGRIPLRIVRKEGHSLLRELNSPVRH